MAGQLEITMWELLYADKYQELKIHIETNLEAGLFAAIDEDTGFNLPDSLIINTIGAKDAKPRELLLYVLRHPQINWSHDDFSTAKQILNAFMTDNDDSIIKGLDNVSGFIVCDNKLTYSFAVDLQKEIENNLKKYRDRRFPQTKIADVEARLAQAKKMVALIRDITILFAIKTDDANLFELLAQAGGDPLETLGDFGKNEITPFLFGVKQPNPQLKAWHTRVFESEAAQRAESRRAITDQLQRHGMFQAEVDKINAEHDAKTTAILAKAGADRIDRVERANTILQK